MDDNISYDINQRDNIIWSDLTKYIIWIQPTVLLHHMIIIVSIYIMVKIDYEITHDHYCKNTSYDYNWLWCVIWLLLHHLITIVEMSNMLQL